MNTSILNYMVMIATWAVDHFYAIKPVSMKTEYNNQAFLYCKLIILFKEADFYQILNHYIFRTTIRRKGALNSIKLKVAEELSDFVWRQHQAGASLKRNVPATRSSQCCSSWSGRNRQSVEEMKRRSPRLLTPIRSRAL